MLTGIGHKLRGHTDELRPRLATTEERRLLSLPQVSVVLELAALRYTADHEPSSWCIKSAAAMAPPSPTRSATPAGDDRLLLSVGTAPAAR